MLGGSIESKDGTAGEVVAVVEVFVGMGECSFGFSILGGIDEGELGDTVA